MEAYNTEAIVLAARDWGNSDKLITFFTRDYGKVAAVAYGARQPKSSVGGKLQLFSHVEVMFQRGRNIDTIKQCTIIASFMELREDIVCIAYGSFFAELTLGLWAEHQPDSNVFDLISAVQKIMQKKNPRIVVLAAAWQLLALAGYKPQSDYCVSCGQLITEPAEFDIEAGGIICSTCTNVSNFVTTDLIFLTNLLALDFNNPISFVVSGATLLKSEQLLLNYIDLRLEKPLKSLGFINSVFNFEQ